MKQNASHLSSGVVANLELWNVQSPLPLLFPSFLPLPPSLSLLSPILPSSPLSAGNNFNDFSENQLTIDFAFISNPAWGNATVSPIPLVLISFGVNGVPRRFPSTTPLYLSKQYNAQQTDLSEYHKMYTFAIFCLFAHRKKYERSIDTICTIS